MDKIMFVCAVTIILFVGTNVLKLMGLMGDSLLKSVNPAVFFLLVAVLFFKKKGSILRINAFYMGLLVTFLFFTFYCTIIEPRKHFMGFQIENLLIPVLFCIVFPEKDKRMKEFCFKLLILSYVVTCVMAITERLILYHFFPLVTEGEASFFAVSSEGFRSTSLHNHPLTNALFITVILSFILISRMKFSYKLFFFFLGYISLLCFNTRSSLLLWPLLFIVTYLHEINAKRGHSNFILMVVLPFLLLLIISFAVIYLGFGDRLFGGNTLMDDSSTVRITVWNMFVEQDLTKLFFSFGYPPSVYSSIMYRNNVGIIENSFVVFAFKMGGLGLLMTVVGYFHIFKYYMRNYTKFQVLFVVVTFLVLGNTNNGIGCYTLCTLLISCMVFPINKTVRFEDENINRLFEKQCPTSLLR